MKVLVTGGCGFIGSNFIQHMVDSDLDLEFLNVDKQTYAGLGKNLKYMDVEDNSFVFDICDTKSMATIFESFQPEYVVNFAAESHVDRSIESDKEFVQTNVEGTRTLLSLARSFGVKKFVQIGTDEIYGSLGREDPSSKESDSLITRSPYSASKAAADLLALSYFSTHGLPVVVTRSSNNYGPYQFPEKIIPLFVTNLIQGKKVPLYGDGKNVRDWLYVGDNCEAILKVLMDGEPGRIYNIGGGNEISNVDLTGIILEEMGFRDEMIEYVEDRKGHDFRYSINCNLIKKELDWKPKVDFKGGLKKTVEWYIKNEKWWGSLK